jgi:anaerobic magnesium-protoporphyrin IX monomethyl ester cyclase
MLIVPPSKRGNVVSDYMAGLGMRMVGSESSLPPLNMLYHAGVLRRDGNEVQVIDAAAEKLDVLQTIRRIKLFGPDKIFIEIRYPSFIDDLSIAQEIKSVCPLVYATGPMASFFAEQIMARYSIDGVDKNTISHIPLNDLPLPARDLVNRDLYFFRTLPRKYLATIITSQGCPYGCIYCPYYVVQGAKVLMRSVDSVMEELTMLYQDGYRSILFRDPIFTFDRQRVKDICERIIRAKLQFDCWVETRTDNLDEGLLRVMRQAGVKGINFGVESGSDDIARAAGRKNNEKSKTKEIIAICRKVGIKTKAFFILGLPGETPETLNETISSAIELNPDYAVFMVATPFPGTKLMELFLAEHKADIFFEKEENYYIPVGLSLEELFKARKSAVNRFYLRPGPVLRELRLLFSVHGLKEAFSYLKWLSGRA